MCIRDSGSPPLINDEDHRRHQCHIPPLRRYLLVTIRCADNSAVLMRLYHAKSEKSTDEMAMANMGKASTAVRKPKIKRAGISLRLKPEERPNTSTQPFGTDFQEPQAKGHRFLGLASNKSNKKKKQCAFYWLIGGCDAVLVYCFFFLFLLLDTSEGLKGLVYILSLIHI